MKLQLDCIDIKDIRFGARTCVKDGVLHINKEEAEQYIREDRRIASCTLDIAYPGTGTRIVNVVDIAEPRCKVTPEGADFPGWIGKIQTAGSGVTRALKGMTVVMTNPDNLRQYLAFLDMGGTMHRLSRISVMPAVVVTPKPAPELNDRDYEYSLQRALFRLCVYLARAGEGHPVSETKIYDHEFADLPKKSHLPRVAYHYQMYVPQYDYKGIPEPIYYSSNVKNMLPTIIHPNEVLDGGVVGYIPNKALNTWSLQNHGLINSLYERHGKDLIFCGVIAGCAHNNPLERERRANLLARLAKDVLQADGIVMTKVHGGMAHMDLASNGEACERLGIKTVVQVAGVVSTGTKADSALFKSELLDAIWYMGATISRVKLEFDVDRVLGGTMDSVIFSPYNDLLQAKDKVLWGEEFSCSGIHDHSGGSRITGVDC